MYDRKIIFAFLVNPELVNYLICFKLLKAISLIIID